MDSGIGYDTSSDEEGVELGPKRFCLERNIFSGPSNGYDQPGPSKPHNDFDCGMATFSDSESEDDKLPDFDRESLLKEIDADIKSLINKDKKAEEKPKGNLKLKIKTQADPKPAISHFKGKDQALYTLEIFMRDNTTCRSKKDRAGKNDKRAPIIVDNEGVSNAIIPPNHKLMLLCKRTATHPRQYIQRGSFVLFKFYVDGEALSEGQLHEASIKNPELHWAKAHIDTHTVQDNQRVEYAHEANAYVGTFVVKVFTKLRETLVSEQFSAVPEDDKVFEKTKRRICCAVPTDSESAPGESPNKQVKKYDKPQSGLAESGLPAASIEVSYDDLLGTRSRHFGQKQFQIDSMRRAGVDEDMLRDAYPNGIPETKFSGTVDLISDDEEEIKLEKVKKEEEEEE